MILKNIQVMRGLAALMVVLAHANLMVDRELFGGLLIIGWCGVDFFFVLSGFIIYWTSQKYFGQPKELLGYMKRRFNRVYPIYWVYTLTTIFLAAIVFAITERNLIGWSDLSVIGLVRNFLLLPTDVPANVMPILPVAWTLSYELLFYALFGITLLVRPKMALILAFLWFLIILLNIFGGMPNYSPNSLFYLFAHSRNIEFLLGCLSAWLVSSGRVPTSFAKPLFLTGFLALIASWFNAFNEFYWIDQTDYLLFGVPFFLMVTGAALLDLKGELIAGRFTNAGMFIGDASYSVYLTHFIVIVVVTGVMAYINFPTLVEFTVASLVSIFCGLIGFIYIERPLNKNISRIF